jgi:hypothetical protein
MDRMRILGGDISESHTVCRERRFNLQISQMDAERWNERNERRE